MATQIEHPREAIAKVNDELMTAFERGDPARLAALYTDGAQVLPPGMGIITGKAGIEALWKGFMAMGIKRLQLNTLDVDQQGDVAIEVGTGALFGEAGNVLDRPKYMVVWKLEDNRWKLHRDMWNADVSGEA